MKYSKYIFDVQRKYDTGEKMMKKKDDLSVMLFIVLFLISLFCTRIFDFMPLSLLFTQNLHMFTLQYFLYSFLVLTYFSSFFFFLYSLSPI